MPIGRIFISKTLGFPTKEKIIYKRPLQEADKLKCKLFVKNTKTDVGFEQKIIDLGMSLKLVPSGTNLKIKQVIDQFCFKLIFYQIMYDSANVIEKIEYTYVVSNKYEVYHGNF